ncbi:MAG: replication factor C large subunit [Nanoarchaeota archaeon]|nr:replication factor C large subunit [Nanoarchaeota archaeon]MBU1703953.1 replication factor C large subunit [Nanoarchaeota archaeon]
MIPYTKKYLPKTAKDVVGQKEALKLLTDFITSYKKQKKKAVLSYGPTGIGKTSAVYAIANDNNLEVVEVNASDFRNKEQISMKVGGAVKQMSLFSKGKVILVDEVDGLSGTKDRGGIPEIISILEESTFPIILTATNPWDNKFSSLRKKCMLVQFEPIGIQEITQKLEQICKAENIKYSEDVLKRLARRSAGDLRAAINDIQTLTMLTGSLEKDSLDELGERERTDTIINGLLKIFKTTDPKVALSAFEYVNEDLDQQLLWIDKNLPMEYTKPEDLARAYDKLSKADIFQRRIRRWQHWRFLVYINALITAGIAVSKDKKYDKYVEYKPTDRILKLWWAKQKSMKKKAIAERIAEKTHCSVKSAIKNIDYFQTIFKNNKDMARGIAHQLDLDKEQVAWLSK